ncbi:MAG: BatD family protein [Flavobacteriales bacterium]
MRLIIFISFLVTQSFAFSQGISVEHPKVVVVGQQFNISYTISTNEVSDLTISNDDKELNIINKRTPSRQLNRDKSVTYVFSVIPEKTGDLIQIPTLSGKVKSLQITSKKSTVNVVSNKATEGRQSYTAQLELNSNTLYEGESIIAELKVYFSINIQDLNGSFITTSKELTIEKLDQKDFEESQALLNGKLYSTAIIGRYRITGESAGNYEIPSLPVNITIRNKVRQGRVTRYTDEIVKINTSPVNLKVLQITQDKPKNYLGVFSELELEVVYPRKLLNYSEAATLCLQLTGKGNFSTLATPELPELNSLFEVYTPSVKSDYPDLAYHSNGTVTFEYTLVPKTEGYIKADNQYLFFFNSSNEKFDSLEIKGFTTNVETGTKKEISFTPEIAETAFRSITQETLSNPRRPIIKSFFTYLIGLISIVLMFVLAWVLRLTNINKKNRLKENVVISPYENFETQLEKMKIAHHSKDAYGKLLEYTESYFLFKFSLTKHSFTKECLSSILPQELALKSIQFIERLELEKFGNNANTTDDAEEIRKLVLESQALIKQIEQIK